MPVGLRVFDEQGQPLLTVGGHLLAEKPALAAKLGELAAEWAHGEAELGGYLATLMETSIPRTFALMSAYRSAKSVADAASTLAKATLSGVELAQFEEILHRFRNLAEERNKVQHCLWAEKPNHPDSLFRVKAIDYSMLAPRILDAGRPENAIEIALDFAASMNDEYDISKFSELIEKVKTLKADLAKLAGERRQQLWQSRAQ